MSDNLILVAAAYQDPDLAQREFDTLVGEVRAKRIQADGVILVAKDAAGRPTVRDTGDHLGRKGAGWGGGVGLLVGLFAPPMLASVAVGAAAGAVVGRFAGHKVRGAIEDKLSENLRAGSALVLGVFPAEQRFAVEQSLPGSPAKSVVEMDGSAVDAIR